MKWTNQQIEFLIKNYPSQGKMWCCEKLGLKECQVRYKAAALGLKADMKSQFRRNAIERMAAKNRGKKRPEQAEVMKRLRAEGKLTSPPKKLRICPVCNKQFYRQNPKNHRKTCSDECFVILTKTQWQRKPHPRGMLGKTHSKEIKEQVSKRAKQMWQDENSAFNTQQQKERRSRQNSEFHKQGILGGKNAYSNCFRGWFEDGEHKYFMRSKWEYNYACYLNFLVKHKLIDKWEYEADRFEFKGIKSGVMTYKPDFKVYINGEIEYHEVKGYMDKKSKTKLNRMRIYYPEIKLLLISEKEYKNIAKQKALFAGWI